MEYQGRTNIVSWVKYDEFSKVDELYWMGMTLVQLVDASKFDLMTVNVMGTFDVWEPQVHDCVK